jgi:hypothetical protein
MILAPSVKCVSESNGNKCTVVRGVFTLYSEAGSGDNLQQEISSSLERIQNMMENGALNGRDERLPFVRFRTKAISTDDIIQGSANNELSSQRFPVWAIVLIVFGFTLLNCLICFCCCCQRKERQDDARDNFEDDEYSRFREPDPGNQSIAHIEYGELGGSSGFDNNNNTPSQNNDKGHDAGANDISYMMNSIGDL